MSRAEGNILAATTLFFTAPLVAEFLLGNLPLKMLEALGRSRPCMGRSAYHREVVRRAGWGGAAFSCWGPRTY